MTTTLLYSPLNLFLKDCVHIPFGNPWKRWMNLKVLKDQGRAGRKKAEGVSGILLLLTRLILLNSHLLPSYTRDYVYPAALHLARYPQGLLEVYIHIMLVCVQLC